MQLRRSTLARRSGANPSSLSRNPTAMPPPIPSAAADVRRTGYRLWRSAARRTASARHRLVAGHQQDGPPPRAERERQPPDPARRIELQLLHVRVPRALQRVDPRPPGPRPERRQMQGQDQQLVLHLDRQPLELGIELYVSGQHILLRVYLHYSIMPLATRSRRRPGARRETSDAAIDSLQSRVLNAFRRHNRQYWLQARLEIGRPTRASPKTTASKCKNLCIRLR